MAVGHEGVALPRSACRLLPAACINYREPCIALRFEVDLGDFQAVGDIHRLPVDLFTADDEGRFRLGGQLQCGFQRSGEFGAGGGEVEPAG